MRLICGSKGVRECDFVNDRTRGTIASTSQSALMRDALDWVNSFFRGEQKPIPPLEMDGTDLEISVWKALTKIPYGTTETYQEVAMRAGRPRAIRATATMVGNNKLALFVPCHRVVPKHPRHDQPYGEYAAGAWRKEVLLRLESQGERFAKTHWQTKPAPVDMQPALV